MKSILLKEKKKIIFSFYQASSDEKEYTFYITWSEMKVSFTILKKRHYLSEGKTETRWLQHRSTTISKIWVTRRDDKSYWNEHQGGVLDYDVHFYSLYTINISRHSQKLREYVKILIYKKYDWKISKIVWLKL